MRTFLLIVTALIVTGCAATGPAATGKQPNILVIMIDDLGWTDLHCQGNDKLDTPFVDKLATQGMRFTDAYAAAPVCSPTRAAIMTGQSPARLHITNHLPDQARFTPDDAVVLPATMLDHLPLEHVTIAERFKDAGYATSFLGKWHMNGDWVKADGGMGDARYLPKKQGFEVNLGGCARGGPTTFWDPYNIYALPDRKEGEYLPDRLADETIAQMRAAGDKPFFICLWNYTVHWPMEAPENLVKKYEARVGPGVRDARYAGMIEAMDASIGRVLAEIDKMGIADDTIVVFTSDNGAYDGVSDLSPLREAKGHLYEGGIRVPLIVRWPGKIKPDTTCNTPVVSMDFYPTLLAAAGLKPTPDHPVDGENILPLLQQTGRLQRDAVYFHYPNYAFHKENRLGSAVRTADYKLIEFFDDGSIELYDMRKDIGEQTNIVVENAAIAQKLTRDLHAWRQATNAVIPERADGAK